MKRLAGLALLCMVGGCGEDFPPSSVLDRTRILGAQLRVVGETPRTSSARAGETVELEFLIASKTAPDAITATLVACVAAEVRRGEAFCIGTPFAMRALETNANGGLVAEFALPDESALTQSRTVLFAGVACIGGGAPSLVVSADGMQRSARCDGMPSARAELITYTTTVERPDSTVRNRVPDPTQIEVQLGRDEESTDQLLPDAIATENCATSALPQLRASELIMTDGQKRQLTLRLRAPATLREMYTPTASAANPNPAAVFEALQISQYSNAGQLARSFTIFEGNPGVAAETQTVKWTIETAEVREGGTPVTFYFVLRDLRGGQSLAARAFCLLP